MQDFKIRKMLQLRIPFLLLSLVVSAELVQGLEYSNSPRQRREENDIATVLLVDNNGKIAIGRSLNAKSDLGLLTSTARTFIKDGVKTEYATQVLGTTLDDGQVYAHLLTKTSRVIYDDPSPTKIYDTSGNKKYSTEDKSSNNKGYIKNFDFISPNAPDAIYIFPTKTYDSPSFIYSNQNDENKKSPQEIIQDEILKESPSNNFRTPFEDRKLKVFKINAQKESDNFILHKELDQPNLNPSKVAAWENLPTFTVRNEFSPSGLSYLGGDLPEFDARTERSRLTTPSKERKAKLLFKAGLIKPNPRDLETVTYKGFADFTTTVANTVIIFTPNTPDSPMNSAEITKISVEPTIRPTSSKEKQLFTERPAYTTTEEAPSSISDIEEEEKKILFSKPEEKSALPSMVIDKNDRKKNHQLVDEPIDLDAKFSVLANEQKNADVSPQTTKSTLLFTEDIIQPSETTSVMLSTPSNEDIAKILASLQARANSQATEPLSSASTVFFDSSVVDQITMDTKKVGGATTIFFEEDPFSFEPTVSQKVPDASETTSEPPVLTTTEKLTTTTEQRISTTEKLITTTEKDQETTTEEILTTTEQPQTTTLEPAQNEIEIEIPEKSSNGECKDGKKVVPTSVYKTLTYLTTFYIPLDDSTSTSVKSNKVISTQVDLQTVDCTIEQSSVETTTDATQIYTTEPLKMTTESNEPTTIKTDDEDDDSEEYEQEETTTVHETTTLPEEITTEKRHVTESEPETTEMTTEEGDEVELIFKTLYTTYTYLTTYFQESTSSVASRIVVTTNVITSTLDPSSESTDEAISGLLDRDETPLYKSKSVSFEDLAGISPSNVGNVLQTKDSNGDYERVITEDEDENVKATPALDDRNLASVSGIKTFYTTYTYFTTIFVGDETKISSRTEVYTNYVTPTGTNKPIKPTNLFESPDHTKNEEDLLIQNKLRNLNLDGVRRQKDNEIKPETDDSITTENNDVLDLSDYETISTMVTDVRSSTSKGERRILGSGEVDKRNVLLDDQIVSESNNDSEIIPSPTLLLQTSFTTFTYYTTLYHGTTSSDVVSRLDTVTNVVTQTLEPTQTLPPIEDQSLPVTYFTTFTYWTTLYKDGLTRVTSREETVSNVVTPSLEATTAPEISVVPLITKSVELDEIIPSTLLPQDFATTTVDSAVEEPTTPIVPSQVGDDDLTTFFTTYTYYTTSYIGDETILNSRLETVTNVLNKSNEIEDNQIGRSLKDNAIPNQITASQKKEKIASSLIKPTGLLSTIVSTLENNGTSTIFSTDVYGTYINGLYAKVLESTSSILEKKIAPSSVNEQKVKPTGIVSINQGKIVDADGISTLLYTTQAVGTIIDGHYAQVIESSSSLAVDQEKKAALGTDLLPVAQRTGLVRLIEGSIIANQTTTMYQSRVLGTFIDGRYAQIIESTSSFLLPTVMPTNANEIVPTTTESPGSKVEATATISPSPVAIESSLSDSSARAEEESTEEPEEDGKSRSRLGFQPKKSNFTPAIRPFSSRPRPAFAPKRTRPGAATAATITRSDFTPTVTAVPASKTGRFGARRSSANSNQIQPTASGSRRFSRPKATASLGGRRSSSSSARLNPSSATGARRSGFRTSTVNNIRPSASNRFGLNRVRPTSASGLNRSPSSKITTEVPLDEENDLTTSITEGSNTENSDEGGDTTLPLQITTESARRNNPLLRFRRPPVARASPSPRTTTTRSSVSRGGNLVRATTKSLSTTTSKPRTTRPNALLNRSRNNNLFPKRNLFTTTTTESPEEENEEEELNEESLEEEDTDYDTSLYNTQTEKAPTTPSTRGRNYNQISIRPFGFRSRSKRDTYSRFRRPTSRTTAAPVVDYDYMEEITSKPSYRNRYQSKYQRTTAAPSSTTAAPQTRKRISPTKPSANRAQFTLREKGTTSPRQNFRKRNDVNGRRTTTNPRSTNRARNSYNNAYPTEPTVRKTTASSRTRSRSRANTRRRGNSQSDNFDDNNVVPKFDGTLTITYQIPTEATIPVVNGKVTEYKNIVTAKLSTDVIGPRQYSTTIGPFGKEQKILLTENTSVNAVGATLVTQFVLNEQPTTSVTFTPTYIRGRKTSFSHVIPSTVYQVEEVVQTIQPALAAQAPLANILLSQLLLGGGVGQNPLLGLQNQNLGQPATPVTEYKTRTTTYVTTLTSTLETVIPVTFRGQQILTTIVDSRVNVVTATEFITDTIVVTPTFNTQPQIDTLLLPLLQQQLQQQQQQPNLQNQLLQQQQNFQSGQTPANVFNLNNDQLINESDIESEQFNLAIEESEEVKTKEVVKEEPSVVLKRKSTGKKVNKFGTNIEVAPKETSVITLYVSGRTPGEFTTVLSTITLSDDTRNKREAEVEVRPSEVIDQKSRTTVDYFDRFLNPGIKDPTTEYINEVSKKTESLESIIGDVVKHVKTESFGNLKPVKSTKKYNINISDLSSLRAPEDAKVETSQQLRGYSNDKILEIINQTNVSRSKSIGNKIYNNGGIYLAKNQKTTKFKRNKRDVNSSTNIKNENDKPRRKVIKKLIRKNPMNSNVSKSTNVPRSIQIGNVNLDPQRKRRRRVKIKKKKKRIITNNNDNFTNLANIEDHEQQATKPRRKVVITRKRVLSNKNKSTPYGIDPSTVKDVILPTTFRRLGYIRKLGRKEPEMMTNDSTENTKDIDEADDVLYEENEQDEDNIDEYDEDEENEEDNVDEDETREYEDEETESNDYEEEESTVPSFQNLPEYEPSFPELTQPFDEPPVLPLITTVLSSVELQTKTLRTTSDKTYTFLITRTNRDKEIEEVTTQIIPDIQTLTSVESVTTFTTLTLLNFEDETTTTIIEPTEKDLNDQTAGLLSNSISSTMDITPISSLVNTEDPSTNHEHEEGRNLATRVMSNGVEVIVKGDRSTRPGDPDFKRVLNSPSVKPVTLKPSTLTNHMMLAEPQKETISLENETPSLYPNQFIVKTCLTTFTYLTTYLEKGQTTVHSHEKVVSNVATEDRLNTGKILPTPQVQVTLTQYPNLNVGVFHTTYSYLNTILDGEQPLVLSSKHVVTNSVTAPDDYLALLHPTETEKPVRDTNTYFSTINLEKTLYEDGKESVISTKELVTQVVITESIRPKQTEIIQIDNISDLTKDKDILTTDVVRTQSVTYSYYNTIMENGIPKIYTNVTTEKKLVTEKMYMKPPQSDSENATIKDNIKKNKNKTGEDDSFEILTTKTYLTTFTYFTTLLQEDNPVNPTVVNSRTKVIENVATETLEHSLFDQKYLKALKNELQSGNDNVKKIATLFDGEKVEITAVANKKLQIIPTKVLAIEKTEIPQSTIEKVNNLEGSLSNTPNVITGSTIIFGNDDPFANFASTPSLNDKISEKTASKNAATILNSEVVKETKISVQTSKVKRPGNKSKNKNKTNNVNSTKVQQNVSTEKVKTHSEKTENKKKTQNQNLAKPGSPDVSDLLGLGSININTLQALTPVLSAMAGYINKNLIDTNRRNDNFTHVGSAPQTSTERQNNPHNKKDQQPAIETQNRSPVYIPVGGIAGDDFEIAESQNIASFDWIDQIPSNSKHKVPQEAPLLSNGIPISPGDIITANSDVIVGKIKGRVGPRLPTNIPLNPNQNEVPIGMKPPPLPNKFWPSKKSHHHTGDNIENLGNVIRRDKPIVPNVVHAPNKEDFVGPPPPPQQNYEKYTGEKRKHIPLLSSQRESQQYASASQFNHKYKIPQNNAQVRNPSNFGGELTNYKYEPNEQNYFSEQSSNFGIHETKPQAQDFYQQKLPHTEREKVYLVSDINRNQNQPQIYAENHDNIQGSLYNPNTISYASNEVLHDHNMPNLKDSIQKYYEASSQKNLYPPVYAQAHDIAPSIPIVLPEVVERKTGQPLLVQLQPSQVAFVNIPFNRTTALIYGGSTEPHHIGQYFDDPSPYPQPEFSAIESPSRPFFASVYNDNPDPNQKQVSGVITVGHQPIKIDPDTSSNQNVPFRIQPSPPSENIKVYGNQEIKISVGRPSLSFGLTENHGDVQAHIIHHGEHSNYPQNKNTFNSTVNVWGTQDFPYLGSSNFAQTESSFNSQYFQLQGNKDKNQFSLPLGTIPGAQMTNQNEYFDKFTDTQHSLNQQEIHFNQHDAHNTKPIFITQQELPKTENRQQFRPSHVQHKKYSYPPKRTLLKGRPRPNNNEHQLSEYMEPPPISGNPPQIRPHMRPSSTIALSSSAQDSTQILPPEKQQTLPSNRPGGHNDHKVFAQNSFQTTYGQNRLEQTNMNSPPNLNKYHSQNLYKDINQFDSELYNSQEDSELTSEDGEVIQESNSRPLLPGELPYEILRDSSKTRAPSNLIPDDFVRFPYENETKIELPEGYDRPPVRQQKRPDYVRPFEEKNGHQRPINIDMSLFDNENVSKFAETESQTASTERPHRYTTQRRPTGINEPVRETLQGEVIRDIPFTRKQEKTTLGHRNAQTYEYGTRATPFGVRNKGTRRPLNSSSTKKPVLIFIDENGKQQSFFNRNKNDNRPKVTSLPIDSYPVNAPPVLHVTVESDNPNSQTEKSFVMPPNSKQPTNQVDIPMNDSSLIQQTKRYSTTSTPTFATRKKVSPPLNSGEIPLLNLSENLTKEINDLEVMKPPPYVELVRTKPHMPNTKMEPPKIELNLSGNILKVPALADEQIPDNQSSSSTSRPQTPKVPSEEMVPPPSEVITEMVLGMTPPPLSSTQNPHNIKPAHLPNVRPETTTKRIRGTRPSRGPFNRRPGYRRTTTTQAPYRDTSPSQQSTTRQTFTSFPRRTTTQRNNERPYAHEVKKPSVTVNDEKSNMEVIIGHPVLDIKDNKVKEQTDSEEAESDLNFIKATPVLETSEPAEIKTAPVHHAGNEIKIIDDTAEVVKNTNDLNTSKDVKKVILPTRYITHTKTMTVTITKTTVVKTSGLPPSTMTILVTKTEKSYIIDTVTEFHTLVKPTSVTETITQTVEATNSLYDNNMYGNGFVQQKIQPSISIPDLVNTEIIESTFVPGKEDAQEPGSIEDFIITETDSPEVMKEDHSIHDKDSIFIVMTDKNNKGGIFKIPTTTNTRTALDSVERDEVASNEIHNNIVLGGILSANHPSHSEPSNSLDKLTKCIPECRSSRNEICQNIQGVMRCICRPGFARMFPDRPCNPTYTFSLNITLDRMGDQDLSFNSSLSLANSSDFINLARRTHEALDRMVMQSDLRDVYHGVQVRSFEPSGGEKGVISRFYLQLSDNIDETRLEDIFRKYLRNNNYSLGGTEVFASSRTVDELRAQDFNECTNSMFHDCSENAQCFNLRGTYTCSCKEGYSDLSENMLYPGRVCSAEKVGCERCNYHGTCNVRNGLEFRCECFHWYAGDSCHINLKALLIALVTLGLILFLLLTICLIMTCVKKKPRNAAAMASGMSFLPQKASGRNDGTLDRRAMIEDTSSEDSRSETNTLPPYVQQKPSAPKQRPPAPPSQTQMKPALKKTSKVSVTSIEQGETGVIFPDQKDRSLTVMIPRAKYHPAPPTSPLMNYTTFDARKPSVPNTNEAKLLAYLDAGPSPSKSTEHKRRVSNALSETYIEEKISSSRKTSGALVSAGFEVSATVVNNMGTLGTICGTEADRSENATLIQKISADLLSSVDGRSQYTERMRKDSLADDDVDTHSNWTGIPRISTISESRSYDETTIPPPMKSFRGDYDTKSSQNHNDEANTMAERDLGSTFLLPHTHLYKPDRGSDISGFESL